jgi:CheY-specific phosphatase CheX
LEARTSETLKRITIETCETLLAGMGLEASHVASRESRDIGSEGRIAVIGFGGEALRGFLVLDLPPAVLSRTHPRHSHDEADLEDWVGELSNLMLGRIKARLLPYDVVIQLSTPLVVTGKGKCVEQADAHSVVHTFVAHEGEFHVLLAADGDSTIELGDEPSREVDLVDEMVMF